MTSARAICHVAVTPIRKEPSHRAEQISQLLFGERVFILSHAKDDWVYISCEWDNYEGWVKQSQIHIISNKEFNKRLHYLSSSLQDFIFKEKQKALISPGSSLFLMRNHQINWGGAFVSYLFKGKKLNLKFAQTEPESIKKICSLFYATPYQWGGRSIFGIDCSGFSQLVYKFMNIRIPRDAVQQSEVGEVVSFLQESTCGDLAFFHNEEGKINHVGVLLNNHTIIHATDTSGCVVIDPIDTYGIISKKVKQRTHSLRLIKRLI